MVTTRSNSRKDSVEIVMEKGTRSRRTSVIAKTASQSAAFQNSQLVLPESKQARVRQTCGALIKNGSEGNLEVTDSNKRRHLTSSENASIVGKKPRLDVKNSTIGKVQKKRKQKKELKKSNRIEVNSVDLTCQSKVADHVEGIKPGRSPVMVNEDEGAGNWEDFGNTSEEENTGSVILRTKNANRGGDPSATIEALQGSQLRRSVRVVNRKNFIIGNEDGMESSSFSTVSDDSDDYDHDSGKDSVESGVNSHGSDAGIPVSYAKQQKKYSNVKNSGSKQVHRGQSKTRKKSQPTVSTDCGSGQGSELKIAPIHGRTRAYISKPPKPWQKLNETIIEGGIVVPSRELRRGEKKMLKFRILAAALALGRNREMTEDEANEVIYQMRTETEMKRTSLLSSITSSEQSFKGDESSSEDEWEEMEFADSADCKGKNVQVMLEKEDEKDWWALYLRQEVNKCVRYNWENAHKVNILCYIGHLQYLKRVILEENLIPSLMLTKMPSCHQKLVGDLMTVETARRVTKWYHSTFKASGTSVKYEAGLCRYNATERYSEMVGQQQFENDADRAALLFAMFVSMECTTRICVNVLPIPRKWDETSINECAKVGKLSALTSTLKQGKQIGKTVSKKKSTVANDMIRNYWIEYWDVKQRRWICVDPFNAVVDDPSMVEENVTKPIFYILAIDNEGGIREVTARYAADFSRSDFRRRRTDPKWITDTLNKNLIRANRNRSELEDVEFRQELVKKPLPTTLSAYKNHPLYVLEKDLLKFEGIYPKPEDQKPLGEVRGHKVYPRSTVYTLQSANNWIKMARSVKEGEKAFKVVKARPNLHVPAEEREQRYLDVFGYWQTEPYRPPKVANGRIPCNEFGNVYMYQPSMCPVGAVHLRLPGLPSIARRLGGLQCVPAVVGWDFNSCSNFPIIEGACVLKEDAEKFINEWKRLEASRKQREEKRREDRVLGHWRKLIRGVLRLHYVKSKFGAIKAAAKSKKKNNELREEIGQSSCIIDRTVMAPCQVFTHDDLMKL